MKKSISFIVAVLLVFAACSQYDDSALSGRVTNVENRLLALEQLCSQMNTNISSLQALVNALQNSDYVTSVIPVSQNGETIGYTICFAKNSPITIYHGKDGQDGKKGENGADGYTPQIGVKQDTDGHYYWTLDGEWLRGTDGRRIMAEGTPGKDGADGKDGANGKDGTNGKDGQNGANGKDGADGKDGITPQLRIQDGFWEVSYDNGMKWTRLGKATGENGADGVPGKDGTDGDSMFSNVDASNPDYVVFTLTDGTELKLLRNTVLSIVFDEEGPVEMRPGSSREIGYTITGNTVDLSIEVLSSGGMNAKINKLSETRGTITIMAGEMLDEFARVVVLVSNGQKSIMSSILFDRLDVRITNGSVCEVSAEGGSVKIDITTNAAYSLSMSEENKAWVHPLATRAWRDETIDVQVDKNESLIRDAIIDLVDEEGVPYESILIVQASAFKMETVFPDPVLRTYLLENFDGDEDGEISMKEALSVKSISVPNKGIQSMRGLELFTNLESLYCDHNKLTSLDVSQNKSLLVLHCYDNQLTDLDVSKNTELINLDCAPNNLTRLDISKNTKLNVLHCEANKLASLDVSQNTNLRTLYCNSNQLTSLDVSKNTNLTTLNCQANLLSSLNVSQNRELEYLRCDYNKLTVLDVANNPVLNTLWCNNNQLMALDVSNNPKLVLLAAYDNQLSALRVDNPLLKTLWCYNNKLTSLDISGCPALDIFNCEINELTELIVSDSPALRALACGHNKLTDLDLSHNTDLVILWCAENELTDLDFFRNQKLAFLLCYSNQLDTLDVSMTNIGNWPSVMGEHADVYFGLVDKNYPLVCHPMETLQTVYLKNGWTINGITPERKDDYIPHDTKIQFKN